MPNQYLPPTAAPTRQEVDRMSGTVVLRVLVGADGLGVPVVRALNTVNIGMGFEAGLVIVLVAIILDRLLRSGERKVE